MTVLYVVTVEVDPAAFEAFRAWYPPHVAEVLAQPGFLRCRRWLDTEDAPDGWRRLHNHYELESRAAFDRYTASEVASRLRQDGREKFGARARFLRALYDADGSWEAPPRSG